MSTLKIIPVGTVFGKLTVLSFEGTVKSGRGTVSLYMTRCSCGRLRLVRRTNLASGRTQSCGREKCARRWAWRNPTREEENEQAIMRHLTQAHAKAYENVKAARPHWGRSNRRLQKFITLEN